jgi:hypothetical protein
MRRMTTTTAIILNGILAVWLLAALALVMVTGHRAAGSKAAEPQPLRAEEAPELDVAA